MGSAWEIMEQVRTQPRKKRTLRWSSKDLYKYARHGENDEELSIYHCFQYKNQGPSPNSGQIQFYNKGGSCCSCTQQTKRRLCQDAVDIKGLHGSKCGWDKNLKKDYYIGRKHQVLEAPKTSYNCTAICLQLFDTELGGGPLVWTGTDVLSCTCSFTVCVTEGYSHQSYGSYLVCRLGTGYTTTGDKKAFPLVAWLSLLWTRPAELVPSKHTQNWSRSLGPCAGKGKGSMHNSYLAMTA